MPADPSDGARWRETQRRRRMLSGRWGPDLEGRLYAHFGVLRRGILGPKSLARNPFRKLCHELACSYVEPPRGRHVSGELSMLFGREGLLTRTGLWPMMRRVQVELIGLRQMFLRPDWSAELRRVVVRMVTPDTVCARAFISAPTTPVEVDELRWRRLPDGRHVWAWDCASIANLDNPTFRVLEARADGSYGEDLTAKIFGNELSGENYPYRWTQGERAGEPWLPYIAYHAMRKETLWDPYEGIEVVEGSLDVATAYTFLQHIIFKASWPQRWGIGVYIAGTTPVPTVAGPRSEMPTDPTGFLHLDIDPALPEGIQPEVGQWTTGADPEMMSRTVGNLEKAVSDFDGLDTSHVVRDSSNPWSAAALQITNEGKRQAQLRYAGELLPSDLETIEKLACIANLRDLYDGGLPESGYLLEYRSLPLSADELDGRRRHNGELIAQGRMSIVDAYMSEHPDLTRGEAEAELKRIAEENLRYHVRPGTQPTAIVVGEPDHTDTPADATADAGSASTPTA